MNTKEKDQHHQSTSLQIKSKLQKIHYQKSFAVKELELLTFKEKKRKNQNTPVEWLAKPTYRDDSANSLTRCIIDHIRLIGGQAERSPKLGRYIDSSCTFNDIVERSHTIDNGKWIKRTGNKGTADISAIIKGRSVKIEVKYGRDSQSEAQRAYQSQVEQAGGVYVIATSLDQFFNWYNDFRGWAES